MSSPIDLRKILSSWPYDPENSARLVTIKDGREVLQVRLPLGIEQYEVDGRPDGERPHELESLLDYHQKRLRRAIKAGEEDSFALNTEECAELFGEGTLYYFRYFNFFQLKQWVKTTRDTRRNLRLFDFVHEHAEEESDQMYLEQWRPYLLRMDAVASAMLQWDEDNHVQAIRTVKKAIKRIEALNDLDDEAFQFEQQRSLATLRELVDQFEETRPVSEVERLERQLQHAITKQEFERAATLRDRIKGLRTGGA